MLKITTWNVNGIRARAPQVLGWVARERPDVVCLQEIKASVEQVPDGLRDLAGYWCYWHGHKGYSGVALLLSRAAFPQQPMFGHPSFDHETRMVTAEVGDVVLTSIYVPNGGKDFAAKVRFLDALDSFAAECDAQGKQLVVCGDLNVAREPRDVHPSLQKPLQIGQTVEERAQIERIIGRGLIDLSRKFYPEDERLFSWWAPWRNMRERNIGWRLDYVLAHRALAERALSCEVSPAYGTSDHAPVHAVFNVDLPRDQRDPDERPSGLESPVKRGQLPLFDAGQDR
jgi:exodeoxyribonuclease-3